MFRHFATGNKRFEKDFVVIFHERHDARITFDVDNKKPLPRILSRVGMFQDVQQSIVCQMKYNIFKSDATLLPQPFILLVVPIERFHCA